MNYFFGCRSLYLLVLALFLFTPYSRAQKETSLLKKKRTTLLFHKAPLETILDTIEAQTDIYITVRQDSTWTFDVDKRNITVFDFLEQELVPRGYTWRFRKKTGTVLLYPPKKLLPPPAGSKDSSVPIIITGLVTDEAYQPLPGATVRVPGTTTGANTDANGRFQLNISGQTRMLEISFIGFEKQWTPLEGRRYVVVQLKPDNTLLDDLFVTGFTKNSRRLLTGNVFHLPLTPLQQLATGNGLIMLQGRVPGLTLEQTSGFPGSALSVQLRGRNSISGRAGPLYVIDGIPYVANFQTANLRPSISTQNVNGGISPFNMLLLGEIKSITVLKDADATAIYGSRGANGVVIIETVRGRHCKPTLDATLTFGLGKVARQLELLSTPQYLAMRREAFRNDRMEPGSTPGTINDAPDLKLWDTTKQTDWQDRVLGATAHITDLNLALTMGTKQTQVRIGSKYYKETTPFSRGLFYSAMGVHVVFDHASKDTSLYIAGFINYSTDHQLSFNGSTKAVFTPPNASEEWDRGLDHPFAAFLKRYSLAKKNYIISIIPEWKPINDLVLKASIGLSGLTTNESDQVPIASQNPFLLEHITGSSTLAGKHVLGVIIEPMVTYTPGFVPGHLTFIAGASFQHTTTKNSIVTGEGYTSDADLMLLNKAPVYSIEYKRKTVYRYGALFGQLKYQWEQKYLLNLSLRRDASSRFGPAVNAGYFWAVGAGWIFSEETFVKTNLPFLYFGKLRGSIGLTGSDLVEDNQYQAVWASNSNTNPYQGIRGLSPQTPYNPDFSWELCLKQEAAIDLSLLKDRIQASFSYYRNKSRNQLVQTNLAAQTGFESTIRNRPATILNTGLEIAASADIVRSSTLRFNLAVNLTLPRNKLTQYENLEQSPYYGTLLLGQPVTGLNRLKSDGVDPLTGIYTFRDLDGIAGFTRNDYTSIGFLDPELLAGIEAGLYWKGMELRVLLDIRKQKAASLLYPMMLADLYPGGLSNLPVDMLHRWQQPGDIATYQQFSALPAGDVNGNKNLIISSDLSYADNSYCKMRELSLFVPLGKKLESKLKCNRAGVLLKGRNLFTISGYRGGDPEIANVLSLSTLRAVSIGVQLTF